MKRSPRPTVIRGVGFTARQQHKTEYYKIYTSLRGQRAYAVTDTIHFSNIRATLATYSELYQAGRQLVEGRAS